MRRLLLLTLALLAVAPTAAQAQRLDAEEVAAECTGTPIRGEFAASEFQALREVAACALAEARKARSSSLRTTPDNRLRTAALAGLRLAIGLDGRTAANRAKVTRRVMERFRCSGREGARVLLADSTRGGGARTPLEVVQSVLKAAGTTGTAPFLGRNTRVAVVALPGRVFAATKTGAIAVAVVGATCASS
jgi:hypothetical protein